MDNVRPPFLVTIDGPASSGKGTLAHRLGAHYGASVLDTGLLYRYVGLAALRAGLDPKDEASAAQFAREKMAALTLADLKDPDLRGQEASHGASVFAQILPLRCELDGYQRDFARAPFPLPDGSAPRGAILDGRDIGTVICPDAPVKLFVTATPDVRAHRRVQDLTARGFSADYETILREIKERDARDSVRTLPAAGAYILDTSHKTIDEVVAEAITQIDQIFG